MSTLANTISDGVTITKRNLIKVKRVPDLIVFSTLSPIMFVLLFVYVFGGAIQTPGIGLPKPASVKASRAASRSAPLGSSSNSKRPDHGATSGL